MSDNPSAFPMTREIPLTRGYVATVDAADFEWLNQWKWHASFRHGGNCYANRTGRANDGTIFRITMHRLILGAPKGMVVDHIDRNTMNNTRVNLRLCTQAENSKNRRANANGSSKYLGVYWSKAHQQWRALIRANNRINHLGLFDHEMDAAKAYDAAARTYHGEFANPNFRGGA